MANTRELLSKGYVEDELYPGVWWSPLELGGQKFPRPTWMRERDACLGLHGINKREDYQGQAFHFRKFCDCFFSDPNGLFHMEWNPYLVEVTDTLFESSFITLCGAKNSSKSFGLAGIGTGYYLLNPSATKVLVTSTTMETAQSKIWGDISYAWDQVRRTFEKWGLPAPGRKMGEPIIRYEMDGIISRKQGIELIPTQASSEKQSVEKVQGYKQENMLFLGDEWDTLPQGLVNTVSDNLSGNPNSKCIAAFNPTGRFTSGGRIARPKEGWDTITVETKRWEGEYGPVIHFDATKSPNIVGPLKRDGSYWKGLMTPEKLVLEEAKYGSNKTAGFWTFVRGWFPPTGELESIYSDAECTQYLADHTVKVWLDRPATVAGCDPSFTHGGDHAMLVIGRVGIAAINREARKTFERIETINLDQHITDKSVAKDEQVVRLIGKILKEKNIPVENLGVDVTGAPSFGSLLNREIGVGWIPVNSSSSPTEMPISKSDSRKCCDVFDSLMSELWYVGKPLIREGQIKGLDADTIEEMCKRTYKGKGERGDKVVVEQKKLMKKRTGSSPDRSDALFISLHVARKRFGLSSGEKVKTKTIQSQPESLRDKLGINWGEKRKQPLMEESAIEPKGGGSWGYNFEGGSDSHFG